MKKLFWLLFLFIPLESISLNCEELIFVSEHWPPWVIIDGDSFNGIDIEIIKEIGRRMDLDLQFLSRPWSRALYMLQNGSAHISSSLSKRPWREEYLYYIKSPYWQWGRICFYELKGSQHNVSSYKDLKSKTIPIIQDNAYFEPFDSDDSLKKLIITDWDQMFQLLLMERVDLLIGNEIVMDYLIQEKSLGEKLEKVKYYVDLETDLYLGISKLSPFIKRKDEFDKHLEDLIDEGFILNSFEKYLGPQIW